MALKLKWHREAQRWLRRYDAIEQPAELSQSDRQNTSDTSPVHHDRAALSSVIIACLRMELHRIRFVALCILAGNTPKKMRRQIELRKLTGRWPNDENGENDGEP